MWLSCSWRISICQYQRKASFHFDLALLAFIQDGSLSYLRCLWLCLDRTSSGLSCFSGGAKLFEIGLGASGPRSMFTALDEASEMSAFETWSSTESSLCHWHGWVYQYYLVLEDCILAREVVGAFSLCSDIMANQHWLYLDWRSLGRVSSWFVFHSGSFVSSSSASWLIDCF